MRRLNELGHTPHTPPIHPKAKTHFIPWRRSVDDGVHGMGFLGSKSRALQPLCMQHKGRVRMLRIACRQSCPSGVAFWEGVGGSSTSGGSKQKQQGTTRGPAESSTSGGSKQQGSSRGSTSGGSSSSPPTPPPSRGSRRGGGGGGRIGENATPEGQL